MARMFSKYSDEHTTALPFENNNKKISYLHFIKDLNNPQEMTFLV